MRWTVGCAISIIVISISLLDFLPNTLAQQTATTSTVPLLFADEFEGSTLNLKKWYRCYADTDEKVGCSNNPGQELEWYQPGNVLASCGAETRDQIQISLHVRADFYGWTAEAIVCFQVRLHGDARQTTSR
jgi:hypothetical protein